MRSNGKMTLVTTFSAENSDTPPRPLVCFLIVTTFVCLSLIWITSILLWREITLVTIFSADDVDGHQIYWESSPGGTNQVLYYSAIIHSIDIHLQM